MLWGTTLPIEKVQIMCVYHLDSTIDDWLILKTLQEELCSKKRQAILLKRSIFQSNRSQVIKNGLIKG